MSFITDTTKGTGVLFNVPEQERKIDGPVMTGSVEINGQRYYISGFLREPKNADAKPYLGLQISSPLPEGYTDADLAAQVRYYGKLFKQEDKHSEASADYTGYITVLASVQDQKHTDDEWEDAAELMLTGHARRNMGDGGARIALNFATRRVASGELAF